MKSQNRIFGSLCQSFSPGIKILESSPISQRLSIPFLILVHHLVVVEMPSEAGTEPGQRGEEEREEHQRGSERKRRKE